jgi:S1-C subfamily serine protease
MLAVVAAVLSAGIAFAAVSAIVGSGGNGPSVERKPAWLGINMASAPVISGGFQSGFGGFPFPSGVVITSVVPGSPAAAAGLEPGDIVTEIGNRQVTSPAGVDAAIANLHAGDVVPLVYDRDLTVYTTQVKLAARPARTP